MPYKNKADRNVTREIELEKKRPKAALARAVRQKARRKLDAEGIDRTGKDIDHVKGTQAGNGDSNLVLKSPSANRSFPRNPDSTRKANKPPKK